MTPVVTFYDCAPDERLPRIARLVEAAWERGMGVIVHCADAGAAEALDLYLWSWKQESFIPHEQVRPGAAPADPEARVVLVTAQERPVAAEVLVQEAPCSFEFAGGFAHVIELVDHRTPDALAQSRGRFRAWREAGANPTFRGKG
ncbi:MAG: DNA polymerase III subunit chi [Deltaproteobacteria bacterium]|nr:DNA polymerase III subunit chi [Deltaproteobacteria bacterium]MCB9788271.1 DNA polymerase III subunit chi [Deltaproteobacteria bacterium]